MPNLICLSMCETRVANLWTTISALSKLSCLVELRFQKWLCNDSASPSASSGGNLEDQPDVGLPISCTDIGEQLTDIEEETYLNPGTDEAFGNLFSFNNIAINQPVQSMMEDSSDDSEVDFSSNWREFGYTDLLANFSSGWNRQVNLQNEVIHMCTFLMYWSLVISAGGGRCISSLKKVVSFCSFSIDGIQNESFELQMKSYLGSLAKYDCCIFSPAILFNFWHFSWSHLTVKVSWIIYLVFLVLFFLKGKGSGHLCLYVQTSCSA